MTVTPSIARSPKPSNPILRKALQYYDLGWGLVPRAIGDKSPLVKWKEFQETRASKKQIEAWWQDFPQANIALVAGKLSGFVVLDADSRAAWDDLLSRGMPQTPIAKSKRGYHAYFQHPGREAKKLEPTLANVDLCGDQHLITAPPSVHSSGWVYDWIKSPWQIPLAPCPDWLLEMIAIPRTYDPPGPVKAIGSNSTRYGLVALQGELDKLSSANGNRNDQLNRSAFRLGQLIAGGELLISDVDPALRQASLAIGLREREISETLKSGFEAGAKQPDVAPPLPPGANRGIERTKPVLLPQNTPPNEIDAPLPPLDPKPALTVLPGQGAIHDTDLGNARRLVRKYGDVLRFVHQHDRWLIWQGTHWQPDHDSEIKRLAEETVKDIYAEAASLESHEQRQARAKWAMKSESKSKIDAMISMSEHQRQVAIKNDLLDSDHWLLNCRNGTLDLRTGQLREHNQNDLITRILPVEFNPQAQAPTWDRFLGRIMASNQELIAFIQRAVGYTLTGLTSEQCLFFMFGSGKNGKSTFIETLASLLGDYMKKTPTETIMLKKGDSIRNDVARLQNARMVVAAETEEGRRLDESLIKDLTGGDTITARYLHKEFFEFKPTHKLWLYGNHKPVIKNTDEGIWRRIALIPFAVTIAPEERDSALPEKLYQELPGILAWAMRGCLEWQRVGLSFPDVVKSATQEYRAEQDLMASWIGDRCVINSAAAARAKELYASYTQWCGDSGEYAITMSRWGASLEDRGFKRERMNYGQRWTGIGILANEKDDPEE